LIEPINDYTPNKAQAPQAPGADDGAPHPTNRQKDNNMTERHTALINDNNRPPMIAQTRSERGVYIAQNARFLLLSATELGRLIDFAEGHGSAIRSSP
jgi:hypothetical protein